ncbi:TadE/TadG family type IV pilus assembly protein [Caulobacter sp.]|uniref:TadE/TadG family type IV pilus assembly protein n=1 Tax=Caulobacter sp. TaxID=78 RepID=UPI002B498E62|nr:TadE/TadG family type IV pilus assembly protein [Caulobacter sp.]HJV43637.1 TadE/TadG family type IV pilus assembly protein [Caulobacter sp.]
MVRPSPLDRARLRLASLAGRFARAERGATAVEFAFVAIPFLMLVFAMIELGLVFLVSLTLENAVMDVGRTIRTGELQNSGGTAATFKTAVCNKMSWVGASCAGALSIDVRTFADFTSSNSSAATMPDTMNFNPGGAGSIVLIRAYYAWPLITPLMQTGLQSANGKRIIYAATAFTNEPYDR